jgi:hypothetical protein
MASGRTNPACVGSDTRIYWAARAYVTSGPAAPDTQKEIACGELTAELRGVVVSRPLRSAVSAGVSRYILYFPRRSQVFPDGLEGGTPRGFLPRW